MVVKSPYLASAVFSDTSTDETPRRIFTSDGSNDAVSRKGVPFGVRKFKIECPKGGNLAKNGLEIIQQHIVMVGMIFEWGD